jgi:hypothetical protein
MLNFRERLRLRRERAAQQLQEQQQQTCSSSSNNSSNSSNASSCAAASATAAAAPGNRGSSSSSSIDSSSSSDPDSSDAVLAPQLSLLGDDLQRLPDNCRALCAGRGPEEEQAAQQALHSALPLLPLELRASRRIRWGHGWATSGVLKHCCVWQGLLEMWVAWLLTLGGLWWAVSATSAVIWGWGLVLRYISCCTHA